MDELRRTVCNRDCPDACGIIATVRNGRVIRLQGDKDHPITRGFLCHRTSHFLERQYAPDRITSPLLRRNGALTPVTWDDALGIAAERLLRIKAESGPAAIFHYRSGGSLGILLAMTDYFFQEFGPATTKRGDICSGAADAAQLMDFGEEDSNDVFDLLNARNIILWGKNVFTSSPHSIPILKDAKARGASLLLIDPVRHQTASLCELFIQPRPGSDVALAMAVAGTLFANHWIDPQAHEYCDNLETFQALACSRSPDDWADIADVTTDQVREVARRLRDGPTTILVGWGMGRRTNGGAIVRALDALGSISGNIGTPGAGVSFYFKRRRAFDTSFLRDNAPRTVCEPLFGQEILSAKDPPIRAVWVTAGNPVAMLPESQTTVEALRTREFVVVADSWMSDTAQLAHLVLPTQTLLEAYDLVGAYGHHYLGLAQPVVAAPPGVKSDFEIMQEMAHRTGLTQRLAGTQEHWLRRILGPKLGPHGVTLETLSNGYLRNPLSPKIVFSGRTFPTATGRVNLIREIPQPEPVADHDYPLWFMSLSTDRSQSSQHVRPPTGPAEVTAHPDAVPGLMHGDGVRIESRAGTIQGILNLDAGQRRDVALMPKGGGFFDGRAANALIRARLTDMGEGAALYNERVRITRAS
jgi:anaerobic selenocysteine-containing dehydrogenase